MTRLSAKLALAALIPVFPALLAASAEPTAAPGYVMPETETWDITSSAGQTYRIFVSKPSGPAPEGGFPVLYVLDGNAMFAGFAEARRIQGADNKKLDQMIVVGVGYPTDQLYDGRRMLDFTGPIQTPALKQMFAAYPSGGREAFLKFMLDDLRPAVGKRYSISPNRQALYGHSLGGLFALYALYTRPGAFRTIIATSPSIWWDMQSILTEEAAFKARLEKDPKLARDSRLFLMAGELEEERVVVGDTIALAKRLEPLSAHGLRTELRMLDGETHVSVPSRSVTASLRAAMLWP